MDKITKRALTEAGWYPEREIDLAGYRSANAKRGHAQLGEPAERFLRSYGGLTFRSSKGRFHFNAKKAAKSILPERVKEYEELLGVILCVIGEANNEYYTLMMDPSGVVYGAFDRLLLLIAPSGEEAIEALHLAKDHKILYSGFPTNDANPHPKRAHLGA